MEKISTGVEGLDKMLEGGLIPRRPYVITGPQGSGKTTLIIQFLLEGIKNGEDVILVAIEEPPIEVKANMSRLGFSMDEINILDAVPGIKAFKRNAKVRDLGTVLDVHVMKDVTDIKKTQKTRVIDVSLHSVQKMLSRQFKDHEKETGRRYTRLALDSMTALKMFSMHEGEQPLLIQSFMRFLSETEATALIVTETQKGVNNYTDFLARGEIQCHLRGENKWISVERMRGSNFDETLTPFVIKEGGIHIIDPKDAEPIEDPLEYDALIREVVPEMILDVIRDEVPGLIEEAVYREVPELIGSHISKEVPDIIGSAIEKDLPQRIEDVIIRRMPELIAAAVREEMPALVSDIVRREAPEIMDGIYRDSYHPKIEENINGKVNGLYEELNKVSPQTIEKAVMELLPGKINELMATELPALIAKSIEEELPAVVGKLKEEPVQTKLDLREEPDMPEDREPIMIPDDVNEKPGQAEPQIRGPNQEPIEDIIEEFKAGLNAERVLGALREPKAKARGEAKEAAKHEGMPEAGEPEPVIEEPEAKSPEEDEPKEKPDKKKKTAKKKAKKKTKMKATKKKTKKKAKKKKTKKQSKKKDN